MGRTYSGNYDFQFDVERWSHPSTPKLLTADDLKLQKLDENECSVIVIPLQINGWVSFTEGYTSGLPENCYPDESESDIESVTDENGEDWINKITPNEMDQLWKKLDDMFDRHNYNSSDYDDRDYSDYEDNYYHPYDDSDYNY